MFNFKKDFTILSYLFLILVLPMAICCALPEGVVRNENEFKNQGAAMHTQFEQAVGQDIMALMENAPSVAICYITPRMNILSMTDVEIVGSVITLNPEEKASLVELLGNDDNYIFCATKKCLFFPEIAIQFISQDAQLLVLVSLSCHQVKFIYETSQTISEGLSLGSSQVKILDFDKGENAYSQFLKNALIIK